MKVAIAVDDWKLQVFRRRLEAAGFKYEDAGPFTGDTTILTVQTDDLIKLQKVLEECQAECEASR